MKFSLVVHAAPRSSQGATSAYRFACAALDNGHSIYRVFFYEDGVFNGNEQSINPQDETSLPSQWQALADKYDIDLVVCISSAARRGIFDAGEAKRQQRQVNLAPGFEISGLGQYVDAQLNSDRLVSFGY